jgi:DNA polymerase
MVVAPAGVSAAPAASVASAAPAPVKRPATAVAASALPEIVIESLSLPGFEPEPVRVLPPLPPPGAPIVEVPLEPRADLPRDLSALQAMVAVCEKCGLCKTRTQTVFSDGTPLAKLMFVGEAPGRDEDLKGVPFVGRAGQLLDKMIAAIDMKRDEIYICNVLKCRPPENRTPLPEEVAQCRPYLEQQVALVRPVVICALGLSAMQALLETKATMGSMRGKTFSFRGIPLIPTYHPAALLRNPGLKRDAWIDLQRVRDLVRSVG